MQQPLIHYAIIVAYFIFIVSKGVRHSKDIADKIIYLYKNPELLKQISMRNLQDAEKFDWNNIIDHYIDLYKSTVST